jgi:hypothetical protein
LLVRRFVKQLAGRQLHRSSNFVEANERCEFFASQKRQRGRTENPSQINVMDRAFSQEHSCETSTTDSGRMLPCERKSVEPMAAPARTAAQHFSSRI